MGAINSRAYGLHVKGYQMKKQKFNESICLLIPSLKLLLFSLMTIVALIENLINQRENPSSGANINPPADFFDFTFF